MSVTPDITTIDRELIDGGHRNVAVYAFDQLPSTSVWLREREYENTVTAPVLDHVSEVSTPNTRLCVTDWQSAGIARRGRTWQTKPGNITFSILSITHRTSSELLGLSLVTGIGIANGLSDVAGLHAQLKWPNDVLLADAKLGGLLTEISAHAGSHDNQNESQILTGVGINVLHDAEVVGLGIGATSLEQAGVDVNRQYRDALVGKLAASVLTAHQLFFANGWAPFAERWCALDWLMNKQVDVHGEDSTERAVARGVNEHGALLVERAGRTLPLYSGNVSIRPTR